MPTLARQNPASMGSAGSALSARAASCSVAVTSARMLALPAIMARALAAT